MYLRDFICDATEANADLLLSLVSYLRRESGITWDLLSMSHVPEDSAIPLAMRRKNRPIGNSRWAGRSSNIPCGDSPDVVAPNMSGSFRRNLRRLARRAEQGGVLELKTYRTSEELRQAFPAFLEVEASGWKGSVAGSGSAIACKSDLVEFYRNMMEHFSAAGACVINLLALNGSCIAGQFCIQSNETLNVIKIGYHEAYSEIAPGNLLMHRVLEDSCRSGTIKAVSFVTDPVWSRLWRPASFELFDHYLFNRTWRGVLAWVMAKGRGLIGYLLRRRAGSFVKSETKDQPTLTQEDKT
jgi:CelD/BcsL family acetyltransferase involved in cellulose biosynthesis